eukprot:359300-Chlamydomonas_euryale.AAC.11
MHPCAHARTHARTYACTRTIARTCATPADTFRMLPMRGITHPRVKSSRVTMRATASAAAMNCSSRSLVQPDMSTPRPTPEGKCEMRASVKRGQV